MNDSVWRRARRIEGWLSKREAELLFDLCVSPWCEVGAWKGRATTVLAASGPGYVVDHFEGTHSHTLEFGGSWAEFQWNTRNLKDVTVLKGSFQRMAPRVGRLRFLYLDANHSYEATREAFLMYGPKVEPGGHVVFHDAVVPDGTDNPWPGVTRFVGELKDSLGWMHVRDAERSAAFVRCFT